MVFDRQAAVDYLKTLIIPSGPFAGLVLDESTTTGNPDPQIFILNQTALTAAALRLNDRTDSDWTTIASAMNLYIDANQSLINQNPLRNYFYPVIPKPVLTLDPSFRTNVDVILYDGGASTDLDPLRVTTNTAPSDPLTQDVSSVASNRALMRCIYRTQIGQIELAQEEYEWIMDNRVFDSGKSLAGQEVTQTEYSSYMLMIQWIAARYLRQPKMNPEFLDEMQNADGSLDQFYTIEGGVVTSNNDHGNSEGTSLAVIADILNN